MNQSALEERRVRTRRLLALSSLVLLACSDATLGLDGPEFMRARVDGIPFSLGEADGYFFEVVGTTLKLEARPTALALTANPDIFVQIGTYHGPDTYPLGDSSSLGNFAQYLLLSGDPPLLVEQRFHTTGQYTGSIRIIAQDTPYVTSTLVGTFQFAAVSTRDTSEVQITEGSFRIHRQ